MFDRHKSKRFSRSNRREAAPTCLVALVCLAVLIVATWAVSNGLRTYEINQRQMLCRSAEVSRNSIYLEKCHNTDFLTEIK